MFSQVKGRRLRVDGYLVVGDVAVGRHVSCVPAIAVVGGYVVISGRNVLVEQRDDAYLVLREYCRRCRIARRNWLLMMEREKKGGAR